MEEARPPLDPHLSRIPLLPLPFILLCQCVCPWMNPAEFATHSEGKLTTHLLLDTQFNVNNPA